MGETEVFRILPINGKCYEHAEYTRKTGSNSSEKYYSSTRPKYVGRCLKTYKEGDGDGNDTYTTFRNDATDEQTTVKYSYEGKTCFKEVPCLNRYIGAIKSVLPDFEVRDAPGKPGIIEAQHKYSFYDVLVHINPTTNEITYPNPLDGQLDPKQEKMLINKLKEIHTGGRRRHRKTKRRHPKKKRTRKARK